LHLDVDLLLLAFLFGGARVLEAALGFILLLLEDAEIGKNWFINNNKGEATSVSINCNYNK